MSPLIKNVLLSPPIALTCGFLYLFLSGMVLFFMGFFDKNDFYRWGPPLNIMGKEVEDQITFYTLLLIFFIHQLINSWISEVVYPYIINEVQDLSKKEIRFKKFAILICSIFAIYSNLDLLVVVNSMFSQASFFVVILLAEFISVILINYNYMQNKKLSEIFVLN